VRRSSALARFRPRPLADRSGRQRSGPGAGSGLAFLALSSRTDRRSSAERALRSDRRPVSASWVSSRPRTRCRSFSSRRRLSPRGRRSWRACWPSVPASTPSRAWRATSACTTSASVTVNPTSPATRSVRGADERRSRRRIASATGWTPLHGVDPFVHRRRLSDRSRRRYDVRRREQAPP